MVCGDNRLLFLWNKAGHYIFSLWFLPTYLSIFLYFIFFSSPILSGRRLDVCHTSTHMVWPCGLQCEFRMQVRNVLQVARWKYRTQKNDVKNRHLRTMAQLYRAVSSQLRQSEKLTLNSNMSSTCLHNMANFYSDNAYNLTNEYHRV